MSAECEQVFSSAKLLITDRRDRLKEDIIKASEVLKSWLVQAECMFCNLYSIAIEALLITLLFRKFTSQRRFGRRVAPGVTPGVASRVCKH